MSGKKKKKKSKGSGQRANFVITLVTVGAIFVFFGYLIGIQVVGALQEQHQTSMQLAQEENSVPVVTAPPSLPVGSVTPAPPAPSASTLQGTPPAPESSQASGALYRVQVGVFSERANADRMIALLKEEGYEGIIISGPPYRVQTGAFSSQENAARLMEELKQKGFEAIIVR